MKLPAEEIDAIQRDMVCMEGMLAALAESAYHGTEAEHLGNSLEILRDYLGQRAERLDEINVHFRVMHHGMNAALGGGSDTQCAFWEKYMEDDGRKALRSREVAAVYARFFRHLAELPEETGEALGHLAEELASASRKQGFVEGMLEAAGIVFGKEGGYGKREGFADRGRCGRGLGNGPEGCRKDC